MNKEFDENSESLFPRLSINLKSQTQILAWTGEFMITNFNGEEINEAYDNLRQNPTFFTFIFELTDDYLIKEGEDEIGLVGLNGETFDYCCKKMRILLFGQQQFAIKEKLWFIQNTDIFISPIAIEDDFKGCTYSNYVMEKVESATSKLGLLFFNDKEIIKDIYSKLNIRNKDLSQTKSTSDKQQLLYS